MSDLPIDDLMTPDVVPAHESDPVQDATDGGWEQAVDEGDGLADDLLGDKPTTPER